MSTHTPGPWEMRQAETGRVSIYPVGEKYRVADSYDGLGNARLIAAAPALLEALEYTLACVNPREYAEVVDHARAAIRAAKGESK